MCVCGRHDGAPDGATRWSTRWSPPRKKEKEIGATAFAILGIALGKMHGAKPGQKAALFAGEFWEYTRGYGQTRFIHFFLPDSRI